MNPKTKLLPPNASKLLYALEDAETRALTLCELRTIQLPFIKHKHHTNFEDLIDFLIWDNGLEEIIFYIRDARTTFGYAELFETARKWKTYQGTIQGFIEAFSWIGYVHCSEDFQNNGNFQIIEFENNSDVALQQHFEYALRFYNSLDREHLLKVKGLAKLAAPLRCKLREIVAVSSSEIVVGMDATEQLKHSLQRNFATAIMLIDPSGIYNWKGKWDTRLWKLALKHSTSGNNYFYIQDKTERRIASTLTFEKVAMHWFDNWDENTWSSLKDAIQAIQGSKREFSSQTKATDRVLKTSQRRTSCSYAKIFKEFPKYWAGIWDSRSWNHHQITVSSTHQQIKK